MWPFNNFLSKKSINSLYDLISDASASSLIGITDGQPLQIQPRQAYNLSEKNNDLGNAVNRISSSIAELKKGLRGDGAELDFNADIIAKLDNPGAGVSGSSFWHSLAESFLLTQEAWIVARGQVDREPLELVFIRPYDISVVMDNSAGWPIQIVTRSVKDRRVYERVEQDGRVRYLDKDKLNELLPIIGVISIVDEWRGRSPLVKLYYDIKMNTDGKRHNVSLLQNGMRTTAAIGPKPHKEGNAKWSPDTIKKLAERLRSFNQGSGNSGNVLLSSVPMDIQGLSQTNKDMDFLSLLTNSQVSIYNLFQIPLPLVLPETMTLDNYTAAQRVYYTKAVFPVFDTMAAGIMTALGPRYEIPETDILTFSEVAVRDLQPVLVENMKKLKETESVQVNEVRAVGGFEPADGGDVILVNSSQVPLDFVSMPPVFPEVEPIEEDEPVLPGGGEIIEEDINDDGDAGSDSENESDE